MHGFHQRGIPSEINVTCALAVQVKELAMILYDLLMITYYYVGNQHNRPLRSQESRKRSLVRGATRASYPYTVADSQRRSLPKKEIAITKYVYAPNTLFCVSTGVRVA